MGNASGDLDLLILDFDGVILDSARVKAAAFVDLFTSTNAPRTEVAAVHERMHGLDRFQQFRVVVEDILGGSYTDELGAELSERYSALVDRDVRLCPAIPGALELLESLLGSVPVWVSSGSPHDALTDLIERRRLTHLFHRVVGAPSSKHETIERAVRTHGADRSQTIMVGDAPSDRRAAMLANVPFVGVVAPDLDNPFPAGTAVVPDLTEPWPAFRTAIQAAELEDAK